MVQIIHESERMTKRQLQEDVYNVESEHDYDPDDPDGELAAQDHYQHRTDAADLAIAEAVFGFTGDSVYG
jgi:hypothetical protein